MGDLAVGTLYSYVGRYKRKRAQEEAAAASTLLSVAQDGGVPIAIVPNSNSVSVTSVVVGAAEERKRKKIRIQARPKSAQSGDA